jgi:multiple sugar transport system substrate-binding protein
MDKQKLNRRDFLRLAGGLAAGTALAACQPKTVIVEGTPKVVKETVIVEGTPKVVKETVIVEKEVMPTPKLAKEAKLSFMFWGDPTEQVGFSARPRALMEKYPNIEVEEIGVVGQNYDTKLYTMVAGGVGPDVFISHNWKALSLVSRELPLDITPFIDRDGYDLSDLFPGSVDYFRYEGKLYGLPLDFPTRAMSYNTDLFDEAGLEYPSADWDDDTWDWDRFLQAAQALTDKTGDVPVFGWDTPYTQWSCLPWIWTNGGRFFNDDRTECLVTEPESVEAFQFQADLIHKYEVAPRPEVAAELGSMSLFMSGKMAMREMGPAVTGRYREIKDFGWDVANWPKAPGKERAIVAVGSGWYVNRATKEPEAAWELEKQCMAREMMMLDATHAGIVSARRSVLNSRAWLQPDMPPEHQKIYADNAERGIPIPQIPKQLELFTVYSDAMSYLWEGKESAAEACARLKEAVDALLT